MAMAWLTNEIAYLRELIVAGEDEDAICVALRRSHNDVREMCCLLGLAVAPGKPTLWCDACCRPTTYLDPKTGWCLPCTTRRKLEAQRRADEEELERLEEARREEVVREENRIKKARQRMREEFGVNPRKGRR